MHETFDVFLSHSSAEPEAILAGIKGYLEDAGLSVYVDKYTDPQLSTQSVTPKTADVLRSRLRASRSLLYVHSRHSKNSRWMPWELGFMDGSKLPIGIVPVVQGSQNAFNGEEYLGLYPYVDRAGLGNGGPMALWINKAQDEYAQFPKWVRGEEEIRKRA
jgi:hypothetical protein